MGWALDGGEDIGGDFADADYLAELEVQREAIKDDRKRRVKALSGKYIVAVDGKGSGKVVFYQDKNISKGYWTQFLSNAFGFINLNTAKKYAARFKHGNPRVALVGDDGIYRWVS